MSIDPYAAPKARVADAVQPAGDDGTFLIEGRGVAAGNGWSWIASAWTMVRKDVGAWIVQFIIFFVIMLVLGLVPFFGMIATYLLVPILVGGIILGCDAVRRGGSMTIGQLFAGFSHGTGKLAGIGVFLLLAFIGIFLIVMLIFGISMVKMFMGAQPDTVDPATAMQGLMTMAIAGLAVLALSVPVYMAIWFSYPLVTLQGFPVGQALRTSFSACLKNIVPFLVYGIAMFFLMIAATIPFGLGWLLLGPVIMASIYTGYRDIFFKA
jgi:hypothetical protein